MRNIMSHSRSIAVHSSSTSSRAKWSLMIGATGPLCVVNPRPHVPSSAVTTQASVGQLGAHSLRMRLYLGYLDIGFATSSVSDHAGRRARRSGSGCGKETGNATISLIFIDEPPAAGETGPPAKP